MAKVEVDPFTEAMLGACLRGVQELAPLLQHLEKAFFIVLRGINNHK